MEYTFDNEHFKRVVEEARQQEINAEKEMKDIEDVLKHSDKSFVQKFMECEPEDFYCCLINCLGSSAMNCLGKHNKLVLKADELKTKFEESLTTKPKYVVWLYKAIKLVAAKVLGFIKFSWDTLLITTTFTGRLAYRLLANIGKALLITADETIVDGKNALEVIKDSFKKNVL